MGSSETNEAEDRNSLFGISCRARSERLSPQNVKGKSNKCTAFPQRKERSACFVQTTTKARKKISAVGGDKLPQQSSTVKKGLLKSKSKPKWNMACILLNAQSIRSKFDEFVCYVELEKPDLICVTETWVSESFHGDRLKDFELQGYNLFSYCRESRQGGGVFVYVNNLYCATEVMVTGKRKEVESVWLDIKTGAGAGKAMRIGAFYRAGNLLRDQQAEMDQFICEEIHRNFKTQCLILGDFNLRAYETTSGDTNECMVFKRLFEEKLFMHQFVTKPTRQNSILDLIFSDNEHLVNDVRVMEGIGKSDHNMIIFNLAVDSRPKNNLIMVPDFNRANFVHIRQELAMIDWNQELAGLDTIEAWKVFKEKVEHIQREHVPFRHKRHRITKKPFWLTSDVLKEIKAKRAAFVQMKNSNSDTDLSCYQVIRNRVKKSIRREKRAKEIDLVRTCGSDSKKFFSFYKFNSSQKGIGPIRVNDALISDDGKMAEVLNDKFQSVFTQEDKSNLAALQCQLETDEEIQDIDDIDCNRVLAYIRKIRPNKAEGPDEIHARFLRECEKEVSVPLAIIFSKSMNDGKIPLDWKRANVVPIHKKGDKGIPDNYRPVSLTSLVCKVLESIIKDKIVAFLDVHNLIKETQHGFRKGRSCLTNLLEFLDFVTAGFDGRKQLDVSYLDFSKAFDKVPHKRLGLQLKSHGIKGNVLRWVQSWLMGRQQRVVINGFKSQWKEVTSGVPQGSVLGPLLFIIFVNKIEDGIDSKVLKFADDIKMVRVIEGKRDQETFQDDLNGLVTWSENWQMKFNLSKCKIMHTGRVRAQSVYKMEGQNLEKTEKERDLGVIFNSKLDVSDQVMEARKRALRMLGVIYRNVSYKSSEVIRKLYCAYVRPILEYCVQAWSPTLKKDCRLLERVQRRATKMVQNLSKLPYEERLRKLNMFSLRYRRLRGDMIEVFKFVHGQQSEYLKGMFEFNSLNRGRGHQYKLIMKRSETGIRQSFFSRRVVGVWNDLPEEIVSAGSLVSFKTLLDKYYMEKDLAFRHEWD